MSTPPPPRGGLGGPTDEPDPTGIRALLSSLPDPGPMPPDLVDRITASIAAEQAARERGTREPDATGYSAKVLPLRSRRWGWPQVAAVAAAAAVIAVGVPTLLNGAGSDVVAAFTSRSSTAQSGADSASERNGSAAGGSGSATGMGPLVVSPSPGTDSRGGSPQAQTALQASATSYAAATLTRQVRSVLAGSAMTKTATPPATGSSPADTPEGLRRCLAALGVAGWMPVSADRATYEGHPAVVALVSTDTGQLVWVVDPSCTAQHPLTLAGPVPLT